MKKAVASLCLALLIAFSFVSCGVKLGGPDVNETISSLKYYGSSLSRGQFNYPSGTLEEDVSKLIGEQEFDAAAIKEVEQMTEWSDIVGFANVLDHCGYKSEGFKTALWNKMQTALEESKEAEYSTGKGSMVYNLNKVLKERPEFADSSVVPFDKLQEYFHTNGKHLSKESGYFNDHADEYEDDVGEWVTPLGVEGTASYRNSVSYEIHGDFLFKTTTHVWDFMDADDDNNEYMFYFQVHLDSGDDCTLLQYNESYRRIESKNFKEDFAAPSDWYLIEYTNAYGSADAMALKEINGKITAFYS